MASGISNDTGYNFSGTIIKGKLSRRRRVRQLDKAKRCSSEILTSNDEEKRMVKQEQTQDRKTMILETAKKLMIEKGYHATSMRDIARACSSEPSNIYYYFTSKEEILLQIYVVQFNRMSNIVNHLDSDSTKSPAEKLRFFIASYIPSSETNYGLLVDAELKHLSPANRRTVLKLRDQHEMILRRIIRQGIDNGDFIKTDEKLLSIMIFSILQRLMLWYSPQGKLSPEEVVNYIYEFVISRLVKNN